MEELLKQLLEGQKQLFEGQKELFKGQKELFEGQKQLFAGQKELFEGQKRIEGRLDAIEAKMDNEFNNLKEADSAILGLIEKTYRKAEQIDDIADDINFLLQRNAKHDNEIREIRKVL